MESLLTITEVCELLRLSRRALFGLSNEIDAARRLPFVRVGNRAIRYRPVDVQNWLNANRSTASVGGSAA